MFEDLRKWQAYCNQQQAERDREARRALRQQHIEACIFFTFLGLTLAGVWRLFT